MRDSFMVTKAIPGKHLPLIWPALSQEQRKTFLTDFADVFFQLAHCSRPAVFRRNMALKRIDAHRTSREMMTEEIEATFAEDLATKTELLQMLDVLINLHPDQTINSLDWIVVDHNDINHVRSFLPRPSTS